MLGFTPALAGELRGTGVKAHVCLPDRIKTEFHTSQGIDITTLPPMMNADHLVTASIAALQQNEVVCVPALADPAMLDRVAEAPLAV